MYQIRMLQPLDFAGAVSISDEVFRNDTQMSMEQGFPYLFSPIYSHSYGAFEEERLVAHMGMLPSKLRLNSVRLPVFSLGSVCTSPVARGNGVGTELLHQVQRHADETGAVLMFISGGRSLYTRNRCYPFGQVSVYTVSRNDEAVTSNAALSESEQAHVRELTVLDCFAWHELVEQRQAAFDFSMWDLYGLEHAGAYASCVMMKPKLYVLERGGKIAAYAYALRPSAKQVDGVPRILEYGGAGPDIALLMQLLLNKKKFTQLQIYVPWQDQSLHDTLSAYPSQVQANDGTVFIPNIERLFQHLQSWWQEREALAAHIEVKQLDNGAVQLRYPDAELVQLEEQDVVKLLFSPDADGLLPTSWPSLEQLNFTVPLPYTVGLYYI
ncbi:GNAT family N-acetyltransferase [Paenibacillus profundus]|uniref:GNAT family N-acetyltransferase n=1 Tax=Paenibacillus profundus TaxID=1173085 RepID=A0ABS8YJL4_9BACL|nr:GNAT family N-acetyltransferase [Paenibacillus profundus]MCE5170535.1 GNAT family N-acetyltransferase [Paenibacillus profundus]